MLLIKLYIYIIIIMAKTTIEFIRYCISLDLPGQDERIDTNHTSLSLFDQKLLANDGW